MSGMHSHSDVPRTDPLSVNKRQSVDQGHDRQRKRALALVLMLSAGTIFAAGVLLYVAG